MNNQHDPLIGQMIRGYCLEELIEDNTVMKIYRARTQELWQTPELIITILCLPESLSTQMREKFMERFMTEAKRVVRLRHSLLFPLFGYGKQDGRPYLLTPTAPEMTLASHMKQKQRWSPAEAFTILVPLAKALTFIHSQGLTYQFLNPANIFLQDEKVPQIAKLNYPQILCLDGLSDETLPNAHLKNIAGAYLGGAEYLAPEVVKGAKADPRSDIYSLGIILFQMLCGHPPFRGRDYLEVAQMHVRKPLPSIHETEPNIPIALELVLNHALYRNPEHRFQTPEDFVTAYTHVLEGQSQVQKRPQPSSNVEPVRTVVAPAKQLKTRVLEEREPESILPRVPSPSKEPVKAQLPARGSVKVPASASVTSKVQSFDDEQEPKKVPTKVLPKTPPLERERVSSPIKAPSPERERVTPPTRTTASEREKVSPTIRTASPQTERAKAPEVKKVQGFKKTRDPELEDDSWLNAPAPKRTKKQVEPEEQSFPSRRTVPSTLQKRQSTR